MSNLEQTPHSLLANDDNICLPTVPRFPGKYRDFALCPGVQGFFIGTNLLRFSFMIPNS